MPALAAEPPSAPAAPSPKAAASPGRAGAAGAPPPVLPKPPRPGSAAVEDEAWPRPAGVTATGAAHSGGGSATSAAVAAVAGGGDAPEPRKYPKLGPGELLEKSPPSMDLTRDIAAPTSAAAASRCTATRCRNEASCEDTSRSWGAKEWFWKGRRGRSVSMSTDMLRS
eukprot:366354-Chlamydomonas_euryale.AAC.1